MTDALRVEDLCVQFENTSLFNGFSLSVATGQQLTLSGASGSGKSTLLRCFMGFVPAATGAIYIQGTPLTGHSVWNLRGVMAYVAQEPELGDGCARDALERPFAYRINRKLAFDGTQAQKLFDAFLLPAALMDKEISALSGGEKQRIALVGALLLKRPILLLDEAASALDANAKRAVRDYLREQKDLTILSVSHDIREFVLSGAIIELGGDSREQRP